MADRNVPCSFSADPAPNLARPFRWTSVSCLPAEVCCLRHLNALDEVDQLIVKTLRLTKSSSSLPKRE